MSTFNFGTFRFNQQTLELSKSGKAVSLRPKPALILGLLLEQPGQVVSKQVLTDRVWGGRLVQDQTLFQTMSELRRALGPDKSIVTLPNVGYRFVLPVHVDPGVIWRTRNGSGPAAYTFAALLVLILLAGSAPELEPRSGSVHAAPAVRAFALGMSNLDKPVEAARYFELATQENSDFLEARLMLSETLLSIGRYDAATEAAVAVLSLARESGLGYAQASAMDLLSRLSELTGAPTSALNWAIQARDTAVEGGYACSAEETTQRLVALNTSDEFPSSPLIPEAKSQPVKGIGNSLVVQQLANQADHCRELLSNPAESDDLSWCPQPEPSQIPGAQERFAPGHSARRLA